jgi:hypothetical protein
MGESNNYWLYCSTLFKHFTPSYNSSIFNDPLDKSLDRAEVLLLSSPASSTGA